MSAIGPGDWVECVDAMPQASCPYTHIGIRVGALYRVSRCITHLHGPALILDGPRHPDNPWGCYGARRFRPIYRPRDNAEFIEALKRPAPADLVEV